MSLDCGRHPDCLFQGGCDCRRDRRRFPDIVEGDWLTEACRDARATVQANYAELRVRLGLDDSGAGQADAVRAAIKDRDGDVSDERRAVDPTA